MRTYGSQFNVNATKELGYTVLDMIFCDCFDAIITSGVGFLQVFKLGQYLHDSPIAIKELKLPTINNDKPWVFQLRVDNKSMELLAVGQQAVFFISGGSVSELHCKRVLKNRHSQSISCAITYPCRNYIITGKSITELHL